MIEVGEGFWLQNPKYKQGRWWNCIKCNFLTNDTHASEESNYKSYCPICGNYNKLTIIAYMREDNDLNEQTEFDEI